MMKSFVSRPAADKYHAADALFVLRIGLTALFFMFCALYLKTHSADTLKKLIECLVLLAASFLPRLLRLEHARSALVFSLFLFFAGVLGSLFSFYEKFFFYDVLSHLFCGVLTVFIAWDLAPRWRLALGKAQQVGFAMLLTVCIASLWEMYEFTAFSILKDTDFSLHCLLAQFGFPAAQETAVSAVKESVTFNFHTVQSLITGAYDTFCDVACALVSGALTAFILTKRQARTNHI